MPIRGESSESRLSWYEQNQHQRESERVTADFLEDVHFIAAEWVEAIEAERYELYMIREQAAEAAIVCTTLSSYRTSRVSRRPVMPREKKWSRPRLLVALTKRTVSELRPISRITCLIAVMRSRWRSRRARHAAAGHCPRRRVSPRR